MNHTSRISVVVPTVGRVATLGRVLDRLDGQPTGEPKFDVIVAADAEATNLADLDRLLKDRSYPARRTQASVEGASAARNAGWRAAEAPLLLFIDDDILPGPRLIEEHLAWHERHPGPEVGVLGLVRWAKELRVTPFMRWLEHGIQFNYPSISGEEAVWGNFYTANVSVKRVLVERVEGFDERELPYGYEDLDLALRMHRDSGFRLLYNRRASAEHLHAMDLDFWKRRVARIAASERRFVELHPEIPAYFHDLFADAAGRARAPAHVERLARFVPGWLPVIGPYVWSGTDLLYRQALAGPFLAAWEKAGTSDPRASAERSRPQSG